MSYPNLALAPTLKADYSTWLPLVLEAKLFPSELEAADYVVAHHLKDLPTLSSIYDIIFHSGHYTYTRYLTKEHIDHLSNYITTYGYTLEEALNLTTDDLHLKADHMVPLTTMLPTLRKYAGAYMVGTTIKSNLIFAYSKDYIMTKHSKKDKLIYMTIKYIIGSLNMQPIYLDRYYLSLYLKEALDFITKDKSLPDHLKTMIHNVPKLPKEPNLDGLNSYKLNDKAITLTSLQDLRNLMEEFKKHKDLNLLVL